MTPTLLTLEALEADRQYVERQISELPSGGWGTSRAMWESRLAEIDSEIAAARASASNFASVALIFDGGPVVGTSDIRLDFASFMLSTYQTIIAISFAAKTNKNLPRTGTLPGTDRSRLYIRDLARGSVGFILEELPSGQNELVPTPLREVVEATTLLFGSLSVISDEGFDSALKETPVRMIGALQKFAKGLSDANATARLLGSENRVALSSDEVNRLSLRLSQVVLDEERISMVGVLRGILPESGQFEFSPSGGAANIISGTVATTLLETYRENGSLRSIVLVELTAVFTKSTTQRLGRPVGEQWVLESVDVGGLDTPQRLTGGSTQTSV